MNSKRFFAFFITVWCISDVVVKIQSTKTPALFFNWSEKKLVEMNTYEQNGNCSSCLSACPVSSTSKEEALIDEEVSITGNGLFLRTFHTDLVYAKEIEIDICETSPKPALVWDILSRSYEIGYEFYYEEKTIEESECLWYKYFKKVIKGEALLNPPVSPNNDRIKMHESKTNTKFELVKYSNKKIVFYWISVLFVEPSPAESSEKQRIIVYTKDTISDFFHQLGRISQCTAYYSGDERNIIEQNREQGQEKVVNRLVKTQIIPMLMFHTFPARLATCMYLNVAFIWQTIADGQMKTVDLFLYGLYRTMPSEIDISFGVNGDANKQDEISTEDELFLKYPVPKILFRIIQYKFRGVLYGAAVVIHNEANLIQETDRICHIPVEGWERIMNTNAATGISYVCPLTMRVVKKLGFDEIKEDLSKAQPLELNKLPRQSRMKNQISFDNLLDKVQDKLDEFKKWNITDFSKKFH